MPLRPQRQFPRASNPHKFLRSPKKAFWGRNWRMAQSRRQVRPRSSRLVHSASFRARNPNKASMTLTPAAASIKVMDALFGLVARNDAECCKRELLGRSWRRDWAMRIFRAFCPIGQNLSGGQFLLLIFSFFIKKSLSFKHFNTFITKSGSLMPKNALPRPNSEALERQLVPPGFECCEREPLGRSGRQD